jgi:uncharacterized protein YcfJ
MDIRTLLLPLAVTATVLIAPAAVADDDYGYEPRTRYVTARVVRVEPILRMVRVSEPRRECWDETYVVSEPTDRYRGRGRYDRDRYGRYGYNNYGGYSSGYSGYDDHGSNPAGSALMGALVGGAIGHQFGSGSGNDAATIAGALIGASVAHSNAVRNSAPRTVVDRHEKRTRCADRYDEREEERVTGYRVTYYYDGQRYVTRMDRDPGDTVRVAISSRVLGN